MVSPNSGHAVDKTGRSTLPKLPYELACVLKNLNAYITYKHIVKLRIYWEV